MRLFCSCLVGLLCLSTHSEVRADEPPKFELKDGDRIVLVGDTLIERDQRYGYLETLLSIANPDKNLVFRNLGWSGDTVTGVSRSGFDPPAAGFEQLKQQILAVKPTVVVVGYGMADSFAGEAGLPAFEQDMNRLLNIIATTKARVVLLSPIAHCNMGPPLPDPASHNRDLALYRDAIKRVAEQRSATFIDLLALTTEFNRIIAPDIEELKKITDLPKKERHPLLDILPSDNGIHLTELGYSNVATFITLSMGANEPDKWPLLIITEDGKIKSEEQTKVSHVQKTANGLRFEMLDRVLSNALKGAPRPRRLRILDLEPGKYELKIDGKKVASAEFLRMERGSAPANRSRIRAGSRTASRDQTEERAFLLPLEAAERHLSDRLSQVRAREQRRRDLSVRPAGRRAGKADRAAEKAEAACLRTFARGERSGQMKRLALPLARVALAAALIVACAQAPALAQRTPFPIPDPDPEIERKSFTIADGFEVNLFAADPVIAKPTPDELRPRRTALDRQLRGLSADQARRDRQ